MNILTKGTSGTLILKPGPKETTPVPSVFNIEIARIIMMVRDPEDRSDFEMKFPCSLSLYLRVTNIGKGMRYFNPTDSGVHWLGHNGERGDVLLVQAWGAPPVTVHYEPGQSHHGLIAFLVPGPEGLLVFEGDPGGSLAVRYSRDDEFEGPNTLDFTK